MDVNNMFAYHFFEESCGPLISLTSLPYNIAINIENRSFSKHERKSYLDTRLAVEKMMYQSFSKKGGKPVNQYPYYFMLNKNMHDRNQLIYTQPKSIKMQISDFNPDTISFTYNKSFETYFRRDNHPTRRKIYTIDEIGNVLDQYGEPEDYCEVQVWSNIEILDYLKSDVSYQNILLPDCKLQNDVHELLDEFVAYFNAVEPEMFFETFGTHGITHTKRVMLLALFLMKHLEIEVKEDIVLVLVAALYHDIGRTHNRKDETHGVSSWKKLIHLKESLLKNVDRQDWEIVRFLVENHCKPEEPNSVLDTYNIVDVDRAVLLFYILRDSDILDRIRIGRLNLSFLHFSEARDLILLAKYLLHIQF